MFIKQGFSQRFISEEFVWVANNGLTFCASLAGVFTSLFIISYLRLNEFTPKLYRISQAFIGLFSLATILTFFFPYSINIKITFLLGGLIGLFVIICGVYRALQKYRPAYYFLFAFSFLILGMLIMLFMNMGILKATIFTEQFPLLEML